MKRIKWILLLISPFLFGSSFSQNIYHFTKGLTISSAPRYLRDAIYADQLAFKLYTSTLEKPSEGNTFGTSATGQELKWQAVTANAENKFVGGRGQGNGYLYLTYNSDKETEALLNIKGNSAVYFNGEPHTGDPYLSGWMYIPVKLKKGLNELYVRGISVSADLVFPEKPVSINIEDLTIPNIAPTNQNNALQGAVVIINTTSKELKNYQIKSIIGGKEVINTLPSIPALATRKVIFGFNAGDITKKGQYECTLSLMEKDKTIDEKKIKVNAVEGADKYTSTFISDIDGSLQYYAVVPQLGGSVPGAALFLSTHGAAVEATSQARSYKAKDWGTLVAPTNRRPRGFNWEDWGRLDALEVLKIAKDRYKPDPQHIYLTGHSMGGHGTWYLGATYPGLWAAIGACSGYPTLKGYGSADGIIPDSSSSVVGQMLLRASNPSDVLKMVYNYKPLGVYILHGDMDETVNVMYARQMRKILGEFHTDLSYYEIPGAPHWKNDESQDWKPIFDFFKWHSLALDTAVNKVDFTTASPGISSVFHWISILQQTSPLKYSRIQLDRNKKAGTITGTTENIRLLKVGLKDLGRNASVTITLDGLAPVKYTTTNENDSLFLLKENNKWSVTTKPDDSQKGPQRYGTLKDAFNKRMVFVYSTIGTKEENEWSLNKARYDAETWYYRSNGAIDIIADKEYSLDKYKGRNVIIYGNANTNAAWNILLKDCPVQITRNTVKIGNRVLTGDDLAAYFIWPLSNSSSNTVGIIGGSGIKGMNASIANQYFAGGSGFPDIMVYRLNMLQSGVNDVEMAGFYDNNWKISDKDIVYKN